MGPSIAYVSFDSLASPKGAAVHIEAFARALATHFRKVDLVTISDRVEPPPEVERWPGVTHHELPAIGASLIERVLCFRQWLRQWVGSRRFDAIQFRSIFEGVPLLRLEPRPRLVFEVNGLPSIELKYRYPAAGDDRELMAKIAAQEKACLAAADRIVAVSRITEAFLVSRHGVDGRKIRVIPNGVDTAVFRPCEAASRHELIYFGTLSAWQGVATAIRAVHKVRGEADVRLLIAGTGSAAEREALGALAAKLDIAQHVEIAKPMPRHELARRVGQSLAVLAPLAVNDRNVVQGCCPLKILEGMSCGVPVIGSDLPAVREIGSNEEHLLLVKPGSVDEMARAIVRLVKDEQLWRRISAAGRGRVLDNYTWEGAGSSLALVHRELQRRNGAGD